MSEKPILLVVDDEEGPRTSLRVVFMREFEVLLAASGREAMKLAKQRPPDVAILDILMQGMSGVDVLRELKALDEDVEVIMLTAYETLDTARQALRLGAREYLNKPFDIPLLRAAVSAALARRRETTELRQAREKLEQLQREFSNASTMQADEASNVVHDLNNPLTVIGGFVELINRQVQSAAKVEGEELEKMRAGIARVQAQVTRCLEISRRYLGERRRAAEEERVAVNEVLVDLKELLSKHPSAQGNEFIVRELDEPVHLAMNGTDLLRVLLNLATNALQCAEAPHRVELIAQVIVQPLDATLFRNADDERFVGEETMARDRKLVALTVRDSGPGITPDVVRRLFDEQVTTKPPGKGTGIGLGSVKALVTAAKGAVRLSTKVGHGTTFTVFLPVH